jgi:HlyD family secretion protein
MVFGDPILKKLLWLVPLLAATVIVLGLARRSTPPRVAFVKVARETLVSSLPTNGKAEPFEWQAVRAETAGVVTQVRIADGQTVARGAVLAEMADPALNAEIRASEAKVAEARASLAGLEEGGRPADRTEIENSLERARMDLKQAQSEAAVLARLAEKQAATRLEAEAARARVVRERMAIAALEKKRSALVALTDVAAAHARLDDAQAALNLARSHAAQALLRAPIAGEIYGLAARPGAYLKPGDLVTNIGTLGRLRVRVYVDEPELGRIAVGQPVVITWQALPGREWQGTVERKPASIEPLGSRQVGEVVCTIANPGRELIPGTNVDAVIRTAVVPGALTIPKEALRHDVRGDYVFRLAGDSLERRDVRTGPSSVARVQVTAGLQDGDAVALPNEIPLQPGKRVTPVI